MHESCAPTDDGADVDSSKGTTQLEVFALEIQMYGETKNNKKLRVRQSDNAYNTLTDLDVNGENRRFMKRVYAFVPRSLIPGSKESFENAEARCT